MKKLFTWAGAALATAVFGPAALASSHREAPTISDDPSADSTDFYMFRSPATDAAAAGTVTFVANYWPLQEPGGGPNWVRFGDNVLYEIKVDNDGDAKEDISFQFRFKTDFRAGKGGNAASFLFAKGPVNSPTDANLLVVQTYTLTRVDHKTGKSAVLGKDLVVPPPYLGSFTLPNYAAVANGAIATLADGNGKVFAGQRDDPFFVDLGAVFDLVRIRCSPGNNPNKAEGCAGQAGKVRGVDYVGGYNVSSLVLQVPISKLTSDGSSAPTGKTAVLGAWTAASRKRVTILRAPSLAGFAGGTPLREENGQWVQVSRLGLPLINEVVVPNPYKDYYNTTPPSNDAALFTSQLGMPLLTNPELAQAMKALYGIKVPEAGRTDILEITQFHIATSAGGDPVGPFKGKTYGLAPADILRVDVSLPPPADQVSNPLGAGGVLLAGANDPNIGFPNGRRLHDDIVDILELVVGGVLRGTTGIVGVLTDGVNANDRAFLTTFPYVPMPWSGSEVGANNGNNTLLHQSFAP
jgi:hypothetical protein